MKGRLQGEVFQTPDFTRGTGPVIRGFVKVETGTETTKVEGEQKEIDQGVKEGLEDERGKGEEKK